MFITCFTLPRLLPFLLFFYDGEEKSTVPLLLCCYTATLLLHLLLLKRARLLVKELGNLNCHRGQGCKRRTFTSTRNPGLPQVSGLAVWGLMFRV